MDPERRTIDKPWRIGFEFIADLSFLDSEQIPSNLGFARFLSTQMLLGHDSPLGISEVSFLYSNDSGSRSNWQSQDTDIETPDQSMLCPPCPTPSFLDSKLSYACIRIIKNVGRFLFLVLGIVTPNYSRYFGVLAARALGARHDTFGAPTRRADCM